MNRTDIVIVGDYTLSLSVPLQMYKDRGKVKYRKLFVRKKGKPGAEKVVAYKDGVPEYYHRALLKAKRFIEEKQSECNGQG